MTDTRRDTGAYGLRLSAVSVVRGAWAAMSFETRFAAFSVALSFVAVVVALRGIG